MAREDLRAAGFDRDSAVLADWFRGSDERAAEGLDLLTLLVAQFAHLVLARYRRVERVHVEAQWIGEDRVEQEEHGNAATQADQVRGDADGLVADLGHEHLGAHVVEDPLERPEGSNRSGDAPRLGAAGAGPVRPVDVSDV